MRGAETRQPGRQPERGEGDRGPDHEPPAGTPAEDLLGPGCQPLENVAEQWQVGLASFGQAQPPRKTMEQEPAEMLLERADLLADRRGRHTQLLGGRHEAAVTRRRLEGAQPPQWRQTTRQGQSDDPEKLGL